MVDELAYMHAEPSGVQSREFVHSLENPTMCLSERMGSGHSLWVMEDVARVFRVIRGDFTLCVGLNGVRISSWA